MSAPVRAAIAIAGLLSLAFAAPPASAQDREPRGDRHQWALQLDVGYAAPSTPLASWIDGGSGKLRYGANDRGFKADRWFAEYQGRMLPTLTAHATADYVDDASSGLDFTEAYVAWRPVPRSPSRHQLKFGLFNPPLSLENTEPGWTSPFTLSSSAINTWIAEEIRTLGAEWRMQRRVGQRGSPHEVAFYASAFSGNDPAGSLLAWKGWSIHDRQSRFSDTLPLPPLPQIQPGGAFAAQDPYVAPFEEIDHRLGYYLGAEWRYARRASISAARYDNRGDPTRFADGQYAWDTRFEQLAARLDLPGGLGLVAQWMEGYTAMGPIVGNAHAVDVEFKASFVLLTKLVNRHRISVRYDDFAVEDNDVVPWDDNSDSGHAWTVAYRYRRSPRLSAGIEWLDIATWHPAWTYAALPARATERLVQTRVTLSLGRGR